MVPERVTVVEKIMDANDQLAAMNRRLLDRHGVFCINLLASPGAGKTTTILKTIELLAGRVRVGVIEGDTAPVTIDADKIQAVGAPAVQINTGGDCHLDAVMLSRGLEQMPLDDLDLLIIENVGNLVCTASFQLGSHSTVLIASVPEGDDKPYKYPNIYRGIDVLLVNKTDLLPYITFNMDYFRQGVEILNPGVQTYPLSATTGEGYTPWIDWILNQIKNKRNGSGNHK
jgi:hydrogenase nickel incorporation protein HypB